MEKRCGRCKKLKTIENFNKRSDRVNQFSSWCKECQKEAGKNRPPRTEYQRKYYEKEKNNGIALWRQKNAERLRSQRKEYTLKNKEEKRLYDVEYRKQNRDRLDEVIKSWRKSNPEFGRTAWNNRRARKKEVSGRILRKEWIDLCEFYNNQCVCCGNKEKLTLDHVKPLISKGKNIIQNVQPLCKSCNSKKHTKTIDYRTKIPKWFNETEK